jgi:hypothetical protein
MHVIAVETLLSVTTVAEIDIAPNAKDINENNGLRK